METVMIPWYATALRADRFAEALREVAAVALRYGAADYEVLRSKDDRYRFAQFATFARHEDFERYWDGPEMRRFRTVYSGWFQVPVLYTPYERIASGRLALEGVGHG
jgi:quinol monooxygenase YgiN